MSVLDFENARRRLGSFNEAKQTLPVGSASVAAVTAKLRRTVNGHVVQAEGNVMLSGVYKRGVALEKVLIHFTLDR